MLLLCALAATGCASLADRYEKGNAALSTPFGVAYTVLLSPLLQSALNECIPKGAPAPSPLLVLVADIDAQGRASDVDVEPESDGADCLERRIGEATLPAPPLAPGERSYPIGLRVEL